MANHSAATKDNYTRLRHGARQAIIALTLLFLLGMAVNLIGLPSETSGGVKAATSVLLGLHVFIAIGLLAGAVGTAAAARKVGGSLGKLAWIAAAGVVVTFTAGVLTMATEENWWSYVMAAGFITVLLTYGAIYARADTR